MTPHLPPALYDEQAELAVLGAILVRNDALDDVADVLTPEHFGRFHHQRVFAAMLAVHQTGRPMDPITLAAQLERMGVLEDVGKPFLYGLGSGVPRSLNIAAYAAIIRGKALMRGLRDHARLLLARTESADADATELLEEAERSVAQLSLTTTAGEWVSGGELASELYPMVEALQHGPSSVTGVGTGFLDLDRFTRGMQPGDLVLVGARPSQGKTALALQVALHAASHDVPTAFFSLEMARHPVGMRGVMAQAQVDGWRMLSGRLSPVEFQRVGEGLAALSGAQIYIDESPALSPIQARSKLRRLKAKAGLGLVVIDYLQLMAPLPEHKRENRTTQVSGISRVLKILARELNVPFLVLSQLNRGLERTSEKRPQLSDLRESGALEQDADVVLLLHRPETYEPNKPELAGVAELIIAKQRNGPIGLVELQWVKESMMFRSRTYRPDMRETA
jgi:replicative DNA helicase